MELESSPSVARNKEPIRDILSKILKEGDQILEIGSGTGEHAAFFCKEFPNIKWTPSEVKKRLEDIEKRRAFAKLKNFLPVVEVDLNYEYKSDKIFDVLFTSNTLHIVSKELVINFFNIVANVLKLNGKLVIYGPFNYNGQFTSRSNEQFDIWLKERDSQSGIRDFEWILKIAMKKKLSLVNDHTMPANNRILEFLREV